MSYSLGFFNGKFHRLLTIVVPLGIILTAEKPKHHIVAIAYLMPELVCVAFVFLKLRELIHLSDCKAQ